MMTPPWKDGWMDRWMDGWMGGRMDGWTDGWMDRWMDRLIVLTVSAAILSAASFLPVGVGVQKTSSAPYLQVEEEGSREQKKDQGQELEQDQVK